MALILSAALFAAFFLDVVLGASSGFSIFNDVQEMVVLFAASIAFVAAILRQERKSKE